MFSGAPPCPGPRGFSPLGGLGQLRLLVSLKNKTKYISPPRPHQKGNKAQYRNLETTEKY